MHKLVEEFSACQNILEALGDQTRQYLILEMMKMGNCNGLRVGEISKKTNLSRPSVSHHLQILKKAGIINIRKEGTKNYYYFDIDVKSMDQLINMLNHVKQIMEALPDRSDDWR
ncbi:ArsR/SmtB family transcription factor [Floccifex sp.]|uniref:ArsR/SmtB family transcription factor n=1 Tax=Floccifex sp. TaxID=2815810 RepID=UPI003F10E30A